jgi:hypothetical protein
VGEPTCCVEKVGRALRARLGGLNRPTLEAGAAHTTESRRGSNSFLFHKSHIQPIVISEREMMKNFWVIILIGSLWAGCGQKENGDAGKSGTPKQPGEVTPSPPAKKPKPLPQEVVKAWEMMSDSCWMSLSPQTGAITLSKNLNNLDASKAVPAFKFPMGKFVFLESMPAPKTPFGLYMDGQYDAHLKNLPKLQQLSSLILSYSQITDAGLKDVAKLQQLTALDLSSCIKITDEGIKELAKLLKLTSLNLRGTRISDAGLAELTHLKQLTSLNLYGRPITDAGVKELAKLQQLSMLNIAGAKITDAGLKELTKLQKLSYLQILFCGQITDAGVKELAKLQQLSLLGLGDTKITDTGLKELAKLQKLSRLNLKDCKQITDAGVAELQKALPNCKIIR